MKVKDCRTVAQLSALVKERYIDYEEVKSISVINDAGLDIMKVTFSDKTTFMISLYDFGQYFLVVLDDKGMTVDHAALTPEEVMLNIEKQVEIL